jgi:hypothetical protein
MPLARYFTFVGSLLLALLFLADWYFPKLVAAPARAGVDKTIIRLHSAHKWPEAIVFDTTLPTLVRRLRWPWPNPWPKGFPRRGPRARRNRRLPWHCLSQCRSGPSSLPLHRSRFKDAGYGQRLQMRDGLPATRPEAASAPCSRQDGDGGLHSEREKTAINSRRGGTKPPAGTCCRNRNPAVGEEKTHEKKRMKRILMIGVALFASTLAMTMSASARLGMAPLAAQDDAVIRVRGGHGHGHGHMGHGGRGHHYGWGRGRGHHYGWRHHR